MVVLFSKRCLSATAQHPAWSFPGLLAKELFCVTRRPSVRGWDTVSPDTRLWLGLHTCVCVMRVQPCVGTDGQHVTAGKGGTSTDACPVASGSGCSAEDRRPSHGLKPQAPPAPGSVGRPKLGAKVVPELEGGCVCGSGGWQGPGSWFLHLLRTQSGIPILSQSAWKHPQERTGQRTRPLAGSWPGGGSPGTRQVAEPWGSRLPSRSFCGASAWIIWKI